MPIQGRFETMRDLHRGGLVVVLSAREAGGGTEKFVVKELRLGHGIVPSERIEGLAERFLAGVSVQAAAAKHAGEGGHWAPVHDSGRLEDGAYFVTDLYARSAERLVSGSVKLDAAALQLVIQSVILGLIELRDAKGRRHGNLHASNILIQGGGERPLERVFLSDPAPSGAGLSAAHDLRALGNVLYQFVVHQGFRSRSGWPVHLSNEWARLGPRGPAWLSLCNRLLDPRLAEQPPSLEEILGEVEGLAQGPRRGRRVLIAASAALLVGAAGAGAFYLLKEPPPPVEVSEADQFDGEAWSRLCLAYYDWFGLLTQSLDPRTARSPVRQRFSADPYLAQIGPALGADFSKLNPQLIASSTRDVKTLATQVPDEAREAPAVRQTREALAVVERVEALLSREGLAQWPLWAQADRLAAAAEGRGWQGAGEYLRMLTGAIRPSPELLTAAGQLLDSAAFIAAVDRLEQAVARAAETEDPVLGILAATVAGVTTAGKRPADLLRDVAALDELVRPLSDVLANEWDLLDQDLFAQSEAHRAFAEDPTPRPQLLSVWLTEARSPRYRLLTEPDPREPQRWDEETSQVLAGITRLLDEFEVEQSQGPADYRSRLGRIDSEIDALNRLKWNTANRAEVSQGSRRVRDELTRLTMDVANAVQAQVAFANQSFEEVRGQLAAIQNVAPSGSPAVDAAWRRERDRLLASETSIAGVRDRSGALQMLLRSVDALVQSADISEGRARDWNSGMVAVAQRQRERVLERVLGAIEWESGIPGELVPAADVLADYDAWQTELSRLRTDMAQLEDHLDGLYPLAQRTEAGEPSADELLARWSASDLLAQPDVQATLAPVLNRMAALQRVNESVDRAALLASAADVGNPALALASWRRLGESGVPWPAVRQSLEDEARLQQLLEGVAGSAPAARRSMLREELVEQGRRRWASHLAAAATPEEIRAAAALKSTLRGEDAGLSPRALFNLRLSELESVQQEAGLDDESLKQRIDAFRAAAMANPDISQVESVGVLLAELGELTSESQAPPPVDVTTLGPGDPQIGWQGEASADGQQVTFRRRIGNAEQSLTFVRVEQSSASAPAAYVATTEVTMGLFTAVAGERSAWEPIRASLPAWDLSDPRQGPRVWEWNTGRTSATRPMVQSRNWLASNPDLRPDGTNEPYPTGAGFPPPGPGPEYPMQYVSAPAAIGLARLLGCRLPTPGEWDGALAVELGGSTLEAYLQERRPNLRDETWSFQKQHVDALIQSRRLGAINSIPPNAGGFWREQPDAFREGYDDGALWPLAAAQGGGRVFQHLIGNVAELVFDLPEVLEALPAAPISAAELQATLAGDGVLGVIGGSAQSPPQVDPVQRQEFPLGATGFSDVGFRLAFSATGSAGRIEPLIAKLGRVLQTPRYQLPD
jgi:hypothetical protein